MLPTLPLLLALALARDTVIAARPGDTVVVTLPVAPPVPVPPAPVVPVVIDSTTPELPRFVPDVRAPVQAGRVIAVAAGANLQAALDAAQPGDVVSLAAGAVFTGNFLLHVKPGGDSTHWIVVRTSGTLPPAGVRLQPGDSAQRAQLATLLTPNSLPALATVGAASGWRLEGVEVSAVPAQTNSYGLVSLGEGTTALQTSLAQTPTRLVLAHVYVHGTPVLNVRRCVGLNSAWTAVVDSYVSECHSNNGDSQALYGWNGPGPFLIDNNYLEAGHEIAGFGGPTPGIVGLIPSDITVRHNYFSRPLAWKGVWRVKNLWECKSCQRVLIERNVMENNWPDAQAGFAFQLQGLTDSNDAPQNRVWDVTIRWNVIRTTGQGINLLSRVAYGVNARLPDDPMTRVAITDNLIDVGPTAVVGMTGRGVQLLQDLVAVTVARNTVVPADGSPLSAQVMFDGTTPTRRLVLADNVFGLSTYGVMGNGVNGLPRTLAKFGPDAVFTGNVFTAIPLTQQIAGNWYPAAVPLTPDFHFTPTAALGGRRIGVDLDALLALTAGVVAGVP